jgi:hypothetical protein
VCLNPILSIPFYNNFLDLLVDVDPRDASTLSSSFLLKGKGGVHAWTSLPANESRVVLGTTLLSTLQLVGIELVSISLSNPFKTDIGVNQNVPLIRKVGPFTKLCDTICMKELRNELCVTTFYPKN